MNEEFNMAFYAWELSVLSTLGAAG